MPYYDDTPRLELGPPEPTLPCLKPGCIRRFFNRTGRSNHIRSKHPDWQQQANERTTCYPIPGPASSGDSDDDIPSSSSDSKRGDEIIDELGDNFDMDIAFDDGYEEDNQRSPASGN